MKNHEIQWRLKYRTDEFKETLATGKYRDLLSFFKFKYQCVNTHLYVGVKLSGSHWGRKVQVFENRVLRRIFGSKRDEVTGEWRRLPNEELYDLYSSPNIYRVIKSRRLNYVWHAARMGARIGEYKVFVRRPEGKGAFGRTTRRWENNVKLDL
jgi:hypothetical protein